jgi:thiosulfate/3-mercaptopyruvate sulfurtransferase
VRSPAEYAGELLAPAHLPNRSAQRPRPHPRGRERPVGDGGQPRHGTFLRPTSCASLYAEQGVTCQDKEVVAYCRIGERSAHTWFVLHEILGHDRT